MELELQKERFEGYRSGAPLLLTDEKTAETIVPDYSPDIARIVEVSACLLLRGRSIADGKLMASGSVKLTLLYMGEDTPGLRALEYSIPFEQSANLPNGCENAAVEGRVCDVEARLLNPRKLFTRLNIEWKVTPYCRAALTTCGEIVEQSAYAIQTLCEQHEVSLIRSVGDKDFVFAEDLTLPGGRDAIGELLCSRVKLRITEAKNLGSKVILKGVTCLSLVYASETGKLCSYTEELPFSQIMDGAAEENGDNAVSAILTLSGSEIHIGEDGRAVSVKLFLNAFVVLRGTENVYCITDLYSTSYDLDAQMETTELPQQPEVTTVTQAVREQLDTGTDIKCVLSADVCFGSVGVRQDGNQASLRTTATVSVLYQDESDVPLSVERRIEITAESTINGAAQVCIENVCAGDITANINANGVELRFPAEFTLVSVERISCTCLSSLGVEEAVGNGAEAPSLVLRALNEGETLWDIAKQYRTTAEDILAANELTDGSALTVGKMLLIPRTR